MKSYWIWNYGDFEIFHSNLVNSRRQEYGADYPCFWKVSSPEANVFFFGETESVKSGFIRLVLNGIGHIVIDGIRYKSDEKISISPGKHDMKISVMNPVGLPSAYIDSDVCHTDGSWYTVCENGRKINVGFDEQYDSPEKIPEKFLFSYKRVKPVSRSIYKDGSLFDFGKEIFGFLYVKNASPNDKLHISYGESYEEAVDTEYSLVFEDICGEESYKLRQRAFRYIYIPENTDVSCEADLEYIPLEYKGSFKCDKEYVSDIWNMCAYTLSLNVREVFTEAVKRDRWLWSGDAYQSYKFNNYIFHDKEIVRRSIIGLRGKDPVMQHINVITDYSLYWIISVWEYYFTYKDEKFLEFIYPKVVSMMEFVKTREDENGFLIGKYDDWIFIDWSEIDKTGAVSAEQMLYIEANRTAAKMAGVLGEKQDKYSETAERLLYNVNKFFWDSEKGAFIDSFESGKRNVTRHSNIFAVMYDIATDEQKKSITENVLLNDRITKITTPYFEGYELDVMGKLGAFWYIENMLESYWKGMLDIGATTVWEEFDPRQTGVKRYGMYNNKYGKSLCHAWGAGPIYLLGRYYLGVYPTMPGYEKFEVAPNLGGFEFIEGTAPAGDGVVYVYFSKERIEVKATTYGGTLILDGKRYELKKDETFKKDFKA